MNQDDNKNPAEDNDHLVDYAEAALTWLEAILEEQRKTNDRLKTVVAGVNSIHNILLFVLVLVLIATALSACSYLFSF